NWFVVGNNKQQSLRQLFVVSSTAAISHGIANLKPSQLSRCWGNYVDAGGLNGYGLVWGTNVATPGLITFYVTATQIVFVVGAGAPALTAGKVVIEYLSAS